MSQNNIVNDYLDSDNSISDNEVMEEPKPVNIDIAEMQHNVCIDLSESILKYSLKLQEKFLLPASTRSDIMDNKSLMTSIITCQNDLLLGHLRKQGYNVDNDFELKNILDCKKYERVWDDCGVIIS